MADVTTANRERAAKLCQERWPLHHPSNCAQCNSIAAALAAARALPAPPVVTKEPTNGN